MLRCSLGTAFGRRLRHHTTPSVTTATVPTIADTLPTIAPTEESSCGGEASGALVLDVLAVPLCAVVVIGAPVGATVVVLVGTLVVVVGGGHKNRGRGRTRSGQPLGGQALTLAGTSVFEIDEKLSVLSVQSALRVFKPWNVRPMATLLEPFW